MGSLQDVIISDEVTIRMWNPSATNPNYDSDGFAKFDMKNRYYIPFVGGLLMRLDLRSAELKGYNYASPWFDDHDVRPDVARKILAIKALNHVYVAAGAIAGAIMCMSVEGF